MSVSITLENPTQSVDNPLSNSTVAVAQWCLEQRGLLARLFAPRRFLCPCDSLYRWLLPRLSPEHLEWALADWIRASLVATDDDPFTLDGKTVRGASAVKETHLAIIH